MSDVTRYTAAGDGVVKTDPAGPLVKWNDYAMLQAEVERLRNLGIKLDGYVDLLQAEVERLRKLFADTERLMLLDGEYEAAKVGTYARLQAEVERVIKAGDWMREALEEGPIDYQCRIDRWNAVREARHTK